MYPTDDKIDGTGSFGDQTKTDNSKAWGVPFSTAIYNQIMFTTNNFL